MVEQKIRYAVTSGICGKPFGEWAVRLFSGNGRLQHILISVAIHRLYKWSSSATQSELNVVQQVADVRISIVGDLARLD
jgi:hypothetical protein